MGKCGVQRSEICLCISLSKPPPIGAKFRVFYNEGGCFSGEWSVADKLDLGAILESIFSHMAVLRDAHFGEAGATRESTAPNLRHRWGDGEAREALATREGLLSNLLYPLG